MRDLPGKVTGRLGEERCPCCGALLFLADAEGKVEIKCRKCRRVIKRNLSRMNSNKPITGSPTEGQGKYESPERPKSEQWGNDYAR